MAARRKPTLLAQGKPRTLGGSARPWRVRLYAPDDGGTKYQVMFRAPDLANAYGKIDPLAVLPIHERLVRNELTDAGAEHYRRAAERLAEMRKLAPTPDPAARVDALMSDLREEHKRRPRLQQEFTRAGLP